MGAQLRRAGAGIDSAEMREDSDEGALGLLLRGLVDDAGLFPPAELAMEDAVARHREDGVRANPVLSGRFVCPTTRLEELSIALGTDESIRLCLIVSPFSSGAVEAALSQAKGDARLSIDCLEGLSGDDLPSDGVTAGRHTFAEVPLTGEWRQGLAAVGAAGHGIKLRCGGLRGDLFPTPAQLGAAIAACAEMALPFKATAGLHHAVRHQDASTGFVHHGFLNLLVAASRAASGCGAAAVVEALQTEDPDDLVAAARALSAEGVKATRRIFVSYGSCSTSEPIEDLRSLDLLAEETSW